MNIKDLQFFLTAVEEENITQAAKRIGYTESGASHIIKRLEKEIGFPLFSRTRKGLVLTSNGERILPFARRIVQANELFIEEASAICGVLLMSFALMIQRFYKNLLQDEGYPLAAPRPGQFPPGLSQHHGGHQRVALRRD